MELCTNWVNRAENLIAVYLYEPSDRQQQLKESVSMVYTIFVEFENDPDFRNKSLLYYIDFVHDALMDVVSKHASMDIIDDYSFSVCQEQNAYKRFRDHILTQLPPEERDYEYSYSELHLEENLKIRKYVETLATILT